MPLVAAAPRTEFTQSITHRTAQPAGRCDAGRLNFLWFPRRWVPWIASHQSTLPALALAEAEREARLLSFSAREPSDWQHSNPAPTQSNQALLPPPVFRAVCNALNQPSSTSPHLLTFSAFCTINQQPLPGDDSVPYACGVQAGVGQPSELRSPSILTKLVRKAISVRQNGGSGTAHG